MQSLVYRLLRKPTTFSDCVDLARRHPGGCVVLELERADRVSDFDLGTELVVHVAFEVDGVWRHAHVVVASYSQVHPDAHRLEAFREANAALAGFVEELEDLGIAVEGGSRRFRDAIAASPSRPAVRPPGEAADDDPYTRFGDADLILRDQLAVDRTVLANERTLLAYGRTALAMVLTGAGGMKLFPTPEFVAAGVALIALGAVVAGVGLWRFLRVRHSMSVIPRGGRRRARQA